LRGINKTAVQPLQNATKPNFETNDFYLQKIKFKQYFQNI